MNYKNDQVRRQDRLLQEEEALQLLKNGEYGVLSLIADGEAYGIPLSYAWDGNSALYIHCAPEGQKLRNIEQCNKVSFCIVGKTQVLPGKFSTAYESVVMKCIAHIRLDKEERQKALEIIVDKYSPEHKEASITYIAKYFERTEIIKLEIIEFSGKSRRNG